MTTAPVLSPGTRVADRFVLVEPLGADGVGTAFRALDGEAGSEVLLRVFPADALPPAERAALRADAAAATRVAHPNVAAPLAAGSDEEAGVEWVAEERARGETLATLLATRGTPPRALALRLLHEMVAGVGAAHRAGVVHGDLHPGNVFLARVEAERRVRVRVTGLGQHRGRAAPRTGMPAAPRYAAPERLRREPALTPAADVFALGVMAHELLAGLPANWNQLLAAVARGQADGFPSPVELQEDFPPVLAEVVLGALEADPLRRFPDADAFGAALSRAAARVEGTPPPPAAAAPAVAASPVVVPPVVEAPPAAAPSPPSPAPAVVATPAASAPPPPAMVGGGLRRPAAADLGDALYVPPTLGARSAAPPATPPQTVADEVAPVVTDAEPLASRPVVVAEPVVTETVVAGREDVAPESSTVAESDAERVEAEPVAVVDAPSSLPTPVVAGPLADEVADEPAIDAEMSETPSAPTDVVPDDAIGVGVAADEPTTPLGPAHPARRLRIVPSAHRSGPSPVRWVVGAGVAAAVAGAVWWFALGAAATP